MPIPSSASAATAMTRTSGSAFTPGVSQAAAVGSGPDPAGDRADRATGGASERRGELAGVDVRAVGRLPELEDVGDAGGSRLLADTRRELHAVADSDDDPYQGCHEASLSR